MTREEITEKLKSLKADIVSCGGCEGKTKKGGIANGNGGCIFYRIHDWRLVGRGADGDRGRSKTEQRR